MLIDARPLRLIRPFRVLPRMRARPKPEPCVCPGPYAHAFCYVVTCECPNHYMACR